jgi:hypothetical protein
VGDDEAEQRVRHAMTTWMGKSERDQKLFTYGEAMTPERWRVVLISNKANNPGSPSRGYQIGALIAHNHNRSFKPYLRVLPAKPERKIKAA